MPEKTKQKRFVPLGRKLLFSIIAASAVLTTVFSSISIYSDFIEEMATLELTIRRVESSALGGIAKALWSFDMLQVQSIANGLVKIGAIVKIAIFDDEGNAVYEIGAPPDDQFYRFVKTYPLIHAESSEENSVGRIEIIATREQLFDKVWNKIVYFLASQGIKTFLLSFIVLTIVGRVVVRYVVILRKFFDDYDFDSDDRERRIVPLKRVSKRDEIDVLIESINHMSLENLHFRNKAMQNAQVEKDLEAARAMQKAILPTPLDLKPIEVATFYHSATQTGGDWYGWFTDTNKRMLYIFIGDASGHGSAAAIMAGAVSGAIQASMVGMADRMETHAQECLQQLITQTNNVIYRIGARNRRHLTMAFIALNLETGECHYANAGHTYVFQVTSSRVKAWVLPSAPLGAKEDLELKMQVHQIKPGDSLFLYTDGLVENQGPDKGVFNVRDVRRMLSRMYDSKPEATVEAVLQHGRNIWQDHPPDDDTCLLVAKWHGPDAHARQAS